MALSPSAHAQTFITWTGAASNVYNTNGNWDTNTAPVAGQVALFEGTGTHTTITVNSAIAPSQWTFDSGAQSYALSGSTVTFSNQLLIFSSNNVSVANVLAGNNIEINDFGSGTLTLSGANTFTGFSRVATGTMLLGNSGALGDSANLVQAASSGTVDLGGFLVTQNGTNQVDTGGRIINGTLSSNSDFALHDGSVSAVLTGTGGVNKSTAGTGTLSGANTYTGMTTVSAGTLNVANASALGNNANSLTVNGGTLDLGNLSVTQNGTVQVSAGGTIQNGTLTSSTAYDLQFGTVSAVLAGSGGANKSTFHTVTLSGANTYTGMTTVSAGTLNVTNASALGNNANSLTVSGGTLDLGHLLVTQNGTVQVSGGGTIQNGTLTSSTAYDLQFGTVSAVLAGSVGANKTTSDTVTLSGANIYSGATAVNSGVLSVDGALTLSATTVNSGGTLSGTGSVQGVTINSGGTLTPGDGTANSVLTIAGPLVFNSGSTYAATVFATNGDNTSATVTGGAVSLGNAALAVTISSGSYTIGNSYTLLTDAAGFGGTQFGGVSYTGSFGSGIAANITYNATSVVLTLQNADIIWKSSPGSSDWNTGSNWSSGSVPTASDAAQFATSSVTSIDVKQANTQVSSVQFNAGASAYTINITGTAGSGPSSLVIGGAGIVNNSSAAQNFVVSGADSTNTGTLRFNNSADAGNATITTNAFGKTVFTGTSTGGTATIITNAGGTFDISGLTSGGLSVGSIAGAGSYVLGANSLTDSGLSSTTVSGVISGVGGSLIKNGAATLTLSNTNTYTGATTINAGTLALTGSGSIAASSGVTANGIFDISATTSGASIQSLSGSGTVTLGAQTLSLTNASGVFSGAINGTGGALTVTGGTQTLSGANGYTGATTISAGTLALSGSGSIAASSGVAANGTFDISATTSGASIQSLSGTGTVTLGARTLTLTNASGTFSGAINGTGGGLTLTGGTQTLSGVNGYTGGTTINGGTLTVGNAAALGATTGAVTVGGGTLDLGGLTVTQNGGLTMSAGTVQNGTLRSSGAFNVSGGTEAANAVFAGTNGVTKSGAGTVTLLGANTYTGGTEVLSGTLAIGNSHALGTGGLSLENLTVLQAAITGLNIANTTTLTGAGAIDTNGNDMTVSGLLRGGGSLVKTGAGALTLTNANTYSGGTTVNAGTLVIGNNNALGTGSLTMANGTVLATSGSVSAISTNIAIAPNSSASFDTSNGPLTLSGVISGNNAGLTKTGTGTLTLSNNGNTANGTLEVGGGTLALTTANWAGAATVDAGAILTSSGTSTVGGLVTNNGTLNVTSGTLDATAGGVTNNGTLNVSVGATLHDDLNNTATVNNSGNYTANVASNTGTINNNNGGIWTGTAHNNNGGTINNNIGATWNGALTNDAGGTVTNAGAWTGGVNNSGTFNNTGTVDSVTNTAGTTTNSSSITGGATVNGGTLLANGGSTIAGGLITAAAGTFQFAGNTTITGNVVNAGAIVSTVGIGTSYTLGVTGSLTMSGGSTYVVQAGPSASFSKIAATGAATLTGSSVLATFAAGKYTPGSYAILTAGGGLGGTTFASLNTLGLSNVTNARNPHLTYDANDVFLTLDSVLVTAQLSSGTPANAGNVARGIDNTNSGVALTGGFGNLYNLSGSRLVNALQQLSGEAGSSGGVQAGFQLGSSFLNLMLNPFAEGRGDTDGNATGYADEAPMMMAYNNPKAADAYAAINKAAPRAITFNDRWNVWGSAYGGAANTRGDATVGSNDTRTTAYGFAAGADKRVGSDLMIGFALAGGSTNWSIANGFGSGRGDVFQAGLYASKQLGSNYISAAVSYSSNWMSTNRTVTVAGSDNLTASFVAQSIGARIEAGHRVFASRLVDVIPYAAMQVQAFFLPSYGETAASGASTFALNYGARTATDVRGEIGAQFVSRPMLPTGNLTMFAKVAYAHDWRNNATTGSAVFQALPGSNFTVNGAAAPKDVALVTAGATMRLTDRASLTAKFDGEFAGGYQSYAGTGTFRYVLH